MHTTTAAAGRLPPGVGFFHLSDFHHITRRQQRIVPNRICLKVPSEIYTTIEAGEIKKRSQEKEGIGRERRRSNVEKDKVQCLEPNAIRLESRVRVGSMRSLCCGPQCARDN